MLRKSRSMWAWQRLDPPARDELLCTAHIFVPPSRDEGLPMVLLEAMAYGLVPVTNDGRQIGEAVSDRVNGLVAAPGRPSQIAEVLTALVTDKHLRVCLGAAARSRASDFGLDGWS
jgi:glycosyltransferase involved in cell wall biosynthesis